MISLNTKEDILKNVSNQTVDVWLWLTHILQNIVFCVQQKKEIHTGLEQHEGE